MDKKSSLPISIKEARKIMGDDERHYTDDELERLLAELFEIAKIYVQSVQK